MQPLGFQQRRFSDISLGNEETFITFYQEHHARLRAEIHRWIKWAKPEDQDDIEQEIWKAVWRGLPRFSYRSTPSTWLTSVARHVIFSWLRTRRSHDKCQSRLAEKFSFENESASWDGIDPVLQHLTLMEDLASVDVRFSVVLRLRYFEQLTDVEVARRLCLPLGTVKQRIRTGLMRLRAVFRNEIAFADTPRQDLL